MPELSWKALALIGLIVTGTGHLADYLLSDRERGWFREALARHWRRMHARNAGELPLRVAFVSIEYLHRLLGRSVFSFRFLSITFVLSATLTVGGLLAGRYLETAWGAVHPPGWRASFRETLAEMAPGGFFSLEILLPANYVFDVMTLGLTLLIMELILKHRDALLGVVLLLIDMLMAAALAFLAMIAIKFNTVHKRGLATDAVEVFNEAVQISQTTFVDFFQGVSRDFDALFYALTSFVPTFFYLLLLICLFGVALIDRAYSLRISKNLKGRLESDPSRTIFSRMGYLFTYLALLTQSAATVMQGSGS